MMYRNLGNRHREEEERREILAARDITLPPALAAKRHLEDNLAAVDRAEALWRSGHSGYGWSGLQLAILEGQTPDEARARIIANYEREWGEIPCRA